MVKHIHEIRDAVHVFARLDSAERKVLDSRPFQRLRHIHQLALTYLVYPGATHRRFEHSLGVMELAERVFQVVTAEQNRDERVRAVFPAPDQLTYWRRVVRMAALCHDIGHLPFSHAAEKRLLPEGMSHESVTVALIESEEMQAIWKTITPPLRADDIAKLAVGPKEYKKDKGIIFSDWESLLSEIIVGDSFGVDRMDYLLRDSLHAGVVYGKFDHYRLIDTLRVLPKSEDNHAPVLGIEAGGVESAEALLLARYFMYSQVYFHAARRAYDLHLQEFLVAWLGEKGVPAGDLDKFLDLTDNEVLAELRVAAKDSSHNGHIAAKRIMERAHYRVVYERNPTDIDVNPDAADQVHQAIGDKFGFDQLHYDKYRQTGSGTDFPIKTRDHRIVSSLAMSDVLKQVPVVAVDYVLVAPELKDNVKSWLRENRSAIIKPIEGEPL